MTMSCYRETLCCQSCEAKMAASAAKQTQTASADCADKRRRECPHPNPRQSVFYPNSKTGITEGKKGNEGKRLSDQIHRIGKKSGRQVPDPCFFVCFVSFCKPSSVFGFNSIQFLTGFTGFTGFNFQSCSSCESCPLQVLSAGIGDICGHGLHRSGSDRWRNG